jgi:hypothetical protein
METVETPFVMDKQIDQQTKCYTSAQANHIDNRIEFALENASAG